MSNQTHTYSQRDKYKGRNIEINKELYKTERQTEHNKL